METIWDSRELTILHEDERLIAVDKPSGLLVHRTEIARDSVTCMSLLRDRLRRRVYPVHRLDRGASGVLLWALDPETARLLSGAFATREVGKSYLAVVRGYAPEIERIDYPLAENGGEPVDAFTLVKGVARVELPIPVGRYPAARYSLVAAWPRTGRWHQIRRHLAHLRHPIVGDTVHGEGRHNRLFREHLGSGRLLLHAFRLELTHPVSGDPLSISAPPSGEFASVRARLGWEVDIDALAADGG